MQVQVLAVGKRRGPALCLGFFVLGLGKEYEEEEKEVVCWVLANMGGDEDVGG